MKKRHIASGYRTSRSYPGRGHFPAFEESSNLLGSFDHGPITSLPARVAREVPMYSEIIARAGMKKL
jgi:hypothetical protein